MRNAGSAGREADAASAVATTKAPAETSALNRMLLMLLIVLVTSLAVKVLFPGLFLSPAK